MLKGHQRDRKERFSSDNTICLFVAVYFSSSYPFPMVFSSCSRKDLENSLEKGVGMCLFNLPEVKESFGGQKCGNGYVEDGEECDCGEPDVRHHLRVTAHLLPAGF